MTLLTATPTQRKNIATLLGYLRQQLVARNDTYDHTSIATCTIGFAIQSRLFPSLNRYTIEKDSWGRVRVEEPNRNHNDNTVVSETVMARLFGKDYLNHIVFPQRTDANPFDPYRVSSIASLRYVIKNIAAMYGLVTAASVNPAKCVVAVETDTLRHEVMSRIVQLEELVKACEVVYASSPLDVVKHTKRDAETELLILKNLLKK
jgi:hypothetical protein